MPLNHLHLHYFLATLRAGSLTAASRNLRLAPSTVSTQIRALEDSLGRALFERRGRTLVCTPHGAIVARYAEQIFQLSDELVAALGETPHKTVRVGVEQHLPKLLVAHLLQPLFVDDHVVVASEATPDDLLRDLLTGRYELVLTDLPSFAAGVTSVDLRLFGASPLTWVATPALRDRWGQDFPASLEGAPVLLPERGSALRECVDQWCERRRGRPRATGEIADSALLKALGATGSGVFVVQRPLLAQVERQYGVVAVGDLVDSEQRFFAGIDRRRARTRPVRTLLRQLEEAFAGLIASSPGVNGASPARP